MTNEHKQTVTELTANQLEYAYDMAGREGLDEVFSRHESKLVRMWQNFEQYTDREIDEQSRYVKLLRTAVNAPRNEQTRKDIVNAKRKKERSLFRRWLAMA